MAKFNVFGDRNKDGKVNFSSVSFHVGQGTDIKVSQGDNEIWISFESCEGETYTFEFDVTDEED